LLNASPKGKIHWPRETLNPVKSPETNLRGSDYRDLRLIEHQ
jgi:hypothetical protein